MKKSYDSHSSYHFYNMGSRPLEFPVCVNKSVVIPAGTTGVKIAFGQSSLTYNDPATGKVKNMNVYLYRGKLYHAC